VCTFHVHSSPVKVLRLKIKVLVLSQGLDSGYGYGLGLGLAVLQGWLRGRPDLDPRWRAVSTIVLTLLLLDLSHHNPSNSLSSPVVTEISVVCRLNASSEQSATLSPTVPTNKITLLHQPTCD